MAAKLLQCIVRSLFPKKCGLVSAFGYGSVAVPQHGRSTSNSQLDIILVVEDPLKWHTVNLQLNPTHYSGLAGLKSGYFLKNIVCKWPHPAVYYNPLVTWHDPSESFPSQVLKYGVVGIDRLLTDLNTWSDLYVGGRLQKPVVFVPQYEPKGNLSSSLNNNLRAALAFSLLQLDFPLLEEDALYHSLASISYRGDWRLYFGEDKKKIKRIITGEPRRRRFRELYLPIFSSEPFSSLFTLEVPCDLKSDLRIHSEKKGAIVEELLDCLPTSICQLAAQEFSSGSSRHKLARMSHEERRKRLLDSAASIVRWASYRQTVLGLFSAGLSRSAIYSFAKFRKMLASL
nr:MMP37 protein mitochondrial [Hymenolepis microstoma]